MYMGNKRIRLCLTGISERLTDESEDSVLEPVCDNGHNLAWYEDLGFPQNKIPKELIQRQKEFELGVELDDEDYEEILSEVVIYESEISSITQDTTTDTTLIYLKNLLTVRVMETPFEIDNIIDYMSMSWFEKKYLYFSSFFRRKNG